MTGVNYVPSKQEAAFWVRETKATNTTQDNTKQRDFFISSDGARGFSQKRAQTTTTVYLLLIQSLLIFVMTNIFKKNTL